LVPTTKILEVFLPYAVRPTSSITRMYAGRVMNSLECQLKRPHFNSVAGKRVKAKYKNSAGQSGDIYSHILIKREYNTLKNVYILIDTDNMRIHVPGRYGSTSNLYKSHGDDSIFSCL